MGSCATHNAGRSALGAALARQQAGDRAVVLSAGIDPAETASAGTIASLAEIGIDDSAHVLMKVTEELVRNSTVLISMEPGLDLPKVDGVVYETLGSSEPPGLGGAGNSPPSRPHWRPPVTDRLDRVFQAQ